MSAALPGAPRTYDLKLEQRYQEVTGGAHLTGGFLPAFEARIAGEHLSFVLVDDDMSYRYEGRVRSDAMDGTVRWGYGPRQQKAAWSAVRVK